MIKIKCTNCGKEIEKHSFAWDGKEKNLVVQALELNKRYEILEQENKKLKKQIESDKGLITVGGKQQYDMTMAYNKCKTALEEIRILATKNVSFENFVKIQNKINKVLNS